jgi:alpha-beta hydrolase superfamily lysophospholipase
MSLRSRKLVRPIVLIPTALLVGLLALGWLALRSYRVEAWTLRPAPERIARPTATAQIQLDEVVFELPGGTQVHGWEIPSRNGVSIVYAHGSPSDRRGLLPEASALSHAGYGALLFDMPGHGETPGRATWGEPARAALRAAVDLVATRPAVRHVAGLGFSMGSSVLASVAATDPRLEAVVLSAVFTDVREQLEVEFGQAGWVTQLPALWAARDNALALDELVPSAVVARIAPRPLLLVAGADDAVVPVWMTERVLASARAPKQLLVVPGAHHGDYATVQGEAYFAALREFFDAAFALQRRASDGARP